MLELWIVRSITTTGARIRVIGAIRVRDTVKIRVKINVNSAQNVIFASLDGSDPPPPLSANAVAKKMLRL